MTQQYQPAPPPPPAKKKHTVRNVILVVVAVFVVIAIATSGGGSSDPASAPESSTTGPAAKPTTAPAKPKATDKAPALACSEQNRTDPCPVQVGQTFAMGKHQVLPGWKVVNESGLDMLSITGKAKNISESTSMMNVDFKFLRGAEVVATVSCYSSDITPGQTQSMKCMGTDPFTKNYDKVTAETY